MKQREILNWIVCDGLSLNEMNTHVLNYACTCLHGFHTRNSGLEILRKTKLTFEKNRNVKIWIEFLNFQDNMNELQKIADIEAQIEAFLKKYDCDNVIDELEISPSPSKRLKKVRFVINSS